MNRNTCRFFGKLVKRWNSNQYRSHRRRPRPAHRRLTTAAAFGAVALMSASLGWTQDEQPAYHPEVLVTGQRGYKKDKASSPKYRGPLKDIPQTITIVPEAVMDEQNATTLRDVLRNVPGISMQAGEGGVPAGDNLSLRGFNARTDIFVDGVRDFGGYSRDPFNLEAVEVVKGPASSYAGRGSTGGSVNLVSKSPALDAFYGGTLGVGTDEFKRATLDVNQPITAWDGAAFRLNALWHDAETPGRDVVEDNRWAVSPYLSFGLGTPTRLTLGYFHMEQDNIPDYGIPWVASPNATLAEFVDKPAPVDFSNWYGLKARDYEDISTDIASAEVQHDFSESLRIRNLVRYGRTDRDSIITAPRFVDIDPGTDGNQFGTVVRRSDWKSRDQINEILANVTDLGLEFKTGEIGHAVAVGAEVSREDEVNHTRVKMGPDSPNTDLFNPNPNDPYTENIQRNGARTESEAKSTALYAFDTVKLSEQWEVPLGLRWDKFDLDFRSIAAGGATTSDLGRTDEMLSWRGGVVFKPVPSGSVYAAYGTSFNPSAEGLTLRDTATAENNVNIDPEESRSVEVGTKWDLLRKRLGLNFALFRTDKINARTQDPVVDTDVVVLEGEQRVQGAEVGLAGGFTERWDVFTGYTFLDSEITASNSPDELGKELSNTPKHTFNLWTTYELPWNIQIGAGAQFVDGRFSNDTNTRQAPSYWLYDAMAAYQVNEKFTLRLNAYNLADKEYVGNVGGGHFIPGAGRSATLTTDVRF